MIASLKNCLRIEKRLLVFTLHGLDLTGRAVVYIKFAAMPVAMGISNTWCQNVFYLEENNEYRY
jgi:hypothetical protein